MIPSTKISLIIAIVGLLILPVSMPASGNIIPPVNGYPIESYCNARFDFCVDYPQNIFTNRELSENGDGAVFSSPNNEVVMTINGEYQVLVRNTKEQMDLLFSAIQTPDRRIDDHTTVLAEDHFVSLIDIADRQVYIRSHKYENYFVNIIVRINDKSYLGEKNLDDEIKLILSI